MQSPTVELEQYKNGTIVTIEAGILSDAIVNRLNEFYINHIVKVKYSKLDGLKIWFAELEAETIENKIMSLFACK